AKATKGSLKRSTAVTATRCPDVVACQTCDKEKAGEYTEKTAQGRASQHAGQATWVRIGWQRSRRLNSRRVGRGHPCAPPAGWAIRRRHRFISPKLLDRVGYARGLLAGWNFSNRSVTGHAFTAAAAAGSASAINSAGSPPSAVASVLNSTAQHSP